MNKAAERLGWDLSNSIQMIEFESKPVLDDISIVIPTLGRDILEQSLFWIVSGNAWPSCLIVVEQGSIGIPDAPRILQNRDQFAISALQHQFEIAQLAFLI